MFKIKIERDKPNVKKQYIRSSTKLFTIIKNVSEQKYTYYIHSIIPKLHGVKIIKISKTKQQYLNKYSLTLLSIFYNSIILLLYPIVYCIIAPIVGYCEGGYHFIKDFHWNDSVNWFNLTNLILLIMSISYIIFK